MELTFSTACSRSDSFLSCQNSAYAHLDSLPFHSLVIWIDGFVLFPLIKEAVTSLLTAYSVVLRSSLHIRQAQFVQVFLLKTAPFYKLYNALISTNKSASFLLFPGSRFVLYTFSSFGLFFHAFWHIWHELSILSPYFLILLQLVPSNLYFPDNDAADVMAGHVQCYRHLQSHEALVSHHLPLVSSHFLSQLQTYCLIKFF